MGKKDHNKLIKEKIKNRSQNRVFISNIKHTGKFKKTIKTLFIFMFSVGFSIGIAAFSIYLHYSKKSSLIPPIEDYKPKLTTTVYSDNNELIGEYSNSYFREVVSYEKIPKLLIKAFIASEDREFFDHGGLNYVGILRAAIKNFKAGRIVQGGSSITQQTAKSFLSDEEKQARSLERKIKEVIMARQAEQIYDKEYIMYLYLNQIYLGHGAYGVQAAAKHYFNKNVWELNLAEISLIAGLPQAPSNYSPYSNLEGAVKRREYVLKRMLDEKFITQKEMDEALSKKIKIVHDIPSRANFYVDLKKIYPNHVIVYDYGVRIDTLSGEKNILLDTTYSKAPYFTEYIHRVVQSMVGEIPFYTGGYKIYTTISLEKQKYARKAIRYGLSNLSSRQGFYGPVEELKKVEYKKFLSNSKKYYLEDKPIVGKRYLALVTKVEKKYAFVKYGNGFEGKILLKNSKWAREENPLKYFASHLIRDLRKPLKEGYVVWIRIYDKEKRDKEGKLIVGLSQLPKPQGALLSFDYKSGYVQAMVGGKEYSDFNRALQAERQSGSIFKPLYYSKSLDEDYTLSTILYDSPIVEYDYVTKVNWKPANYGNNYKGEVTLRTALKDSMNIPSIKVFQHLGADKVENWVSRLGISSCLKVKANPGSDGAKEFKEGPCKGWYYPHIDSSIALGSAAIKLIDIVKAFSLFPNYGQREKMVFIKKIVDKNGNIILDNTNFNDPFIAPESIKERITYELFRERERVIDPTTAFLTLRLLRAVVKSGTSTSVNSLKIPIAGKTGTTNDSFDTWFVGFSTSLLTGVWIGYDLNDNPLGRGEAGGKTSLPVWKHYTKNALSYHIKNKKEKEFEASENIEWVKIDRETGKKASPSTIVRIKEAYRLGTAPEESDDNPNVMDTDDLLMGN